MPGSARLTETPRIFEDSVAVSPGLIDQEIGFTKFSRSTGDSDLFVMDAAGTGTRNLRNTGRIDEFGADWSPDGEKITFTSARFSGLEGAAARVADAQADPQEDEAFTPGAWCQNHWRVKPPSPRRQPPHPKRTSRSPR